MNMSANADNKNMNIEMSSENEEDEWDTIYNEDDKEKQADENGREYVDYWTRWRSMWWLCGLYRQRHSMPRPSPGNQPHRTPPTHPM